MKNRKILHQFKQLTGKIYTPEIIYQSGLNFTVFHLHEISPSLRGYRVQKFKHAFCHRATFGRICVKAELTFGPYILLMKGVSILSSEKSQNSNRIGINKALLTELYFHKDPYATDSKLYKTQNPASSIGVY